MFCLGAGQAACRAAAAARNTPRRAQALAQVAHPQRSAAGFRDTHLHPERPTGGSAAGSRKAGQKALRAAASWRNLQYQAHGNTRIHSKTQARARRARTYLHTDKPSRPIKRPNAKASHYPQMPHRAGSDLMTVLTVSRANTQG